MNTVGDRLKYALDVRKSTQTKLHKETGLSVSTINHIAQNLKTPTPRTARAICSILGVNEEWLLHGTGEMNKELTIDEELGQLMSPLFENGKHVNAKKRLIASLLKLPDEGWDMLLDIFDEVVAEVKNDSFSGGDE